MRSNTNSRNPAPQEPGKLAADRETLWANLSTFLLPRVKRWVYSAHIPSWLGQQEDVAQDIVQETLYKLLNYIQRAEKGEVAPVLDLQRLAIKIAHNYLRDLMRKDNRLERFEMYDRTSLEHVVKSRAIDPSEVALEQVYQAWLFCKVAEFAAIIAAKQRTALLRDLAQHMSFMQELTLLQQAFKEKGMDFKQYQNWKATNGQERSRHAASLSISYKKITQWSKESSLQ